jgi:hypothetical protein
MCISCERILVHWSIAAAFRTALILIVTKAYGTSQVLAQSAGVIRVGNLLLDAAVHPMPAPMHNANGCSTQNPSTPS